MATRKICELCIALLIIVGSLNANAAVITETWSADISGFTGALNTGDRISWVVLYDDNPGSSMTEWADGSNGIAEFGNADDTFNGNWQLSNYPSSYLMFTDVISSSFFDLITLAGIGHAGTPYNRHDINRHRRYTAIDGRAHYDGIADDLVWDFVGNSSASHGVLYQYYESYGGVSQHTTYFTDVTVTTRQVPTPPTIALALIGLLGWGASRRKTLSHSALL